MNSSGVVQKVLEADDIGVVYRTRKGSVRALDSLSLSVRQGEFVSVLGPSGCGKSTLLRLFSGLMAPTTGEVRLNGARVAKPTGETGIVFQKPTLLPWKTVLENVLIPARALKLDQGDARRNAERLLKLAGIEEFAGNYPGELSGGMQQRVAIVRSLNHDPSLLLMDEPFSALDTMTREFMGLELQKIWLESQKSVLFITHSIQEAVYLSDRVVVMSARPGRITDEVNVKFDRPRELSIMSDPDFNEICRDLRQRFAEIHDAA